MHNCQEYRTWSKIVKKQIISILTLFLVLVPFVNAQNIGSTSVKTWAGDKKSAFSFSFDDGFKSQIDNAAPVLDKYGFKATFYVIAGSLVDQGQELIWRYGTWEGFKQLADEGHEIGSHTMTHHNLTKLDKGDIYTQGTLDYELYKSKQLIEQKIGHKVITLGYPFNTYNSLVQQEAARFYESSRAGGGVSNPPEIYNLDWQKLSSLEEQFNTPRSKFSDDADELTNVKYWTQNLINNNKWGIFFAHEVIPYSEIPAASQNTQDYWFPMATEWLDSLCNYMNTKVNDNDVWVSTVANVTRYIKERENFSSSIIASANTRIELQVTDGLDDSIFNFPLTVDIEVPSGWTSVKFLQGTINKEVNTFTNYGNTFVRVNVIPDGGNVILENSAATTYYTLSGKITYDNDSSTPLKNVTVKLKDSNGVEISTISDNNGNYLFSNLVAGTYTLSFNKLDGWGGVNATDALLAVKYFSNSITLSSLQIESGDVDKNGVINATDALLMVRRYANLISGFSIPDWIFSAQNNSIQITNADVQENIQAIAAGDISRSFVPN